MADFADFELGQNIAELADGLLPEMAEVFQVPLSPEPTPDELGALVGALGTKKTLRDNEVDVKSRLVKATGSEDKALDLAINWMDRSGVQDALDRSLWTPSLITPPDVSIVMTGGVANWQDRTARLVAKRPHNPVYIPVGNRVMGTDTEKVNTNVADFFENEGRYPTEAEYAELYVAPVISTADRDVTLHPYDTADGQEIANHFFEDETMLFMGGYVAFARVANAGIQLACQFRKAGEASGFDLNRREPQAFVLTDTFPVARTLEEAEDAAHFQKPFTGIRQIAVTGKMLVEAALD